MPNPKKRIFRKLRIREISGVDSPAQEGAVVSLVKMAKPSDEEDEKNPNPVTPDEAAAAAPDANDQEPNMPDQDKITADKLAAAETRIKQLESDVAKANAKVTALTNLTAEETAYAKALRESDRDVFLAKSAGDRATELKDAVVYKAADGTLYLRSDDARLVKMAKDRDEDHKRHNELIEKAEVTELAKRFSTEMKHLPLDEAAGVALLKAVGAISDEKVREAVTKALKAHDGKQAEGFEESGINPGDPVTKSAQDAFDEGVAKFAKANNLDITKAKDLGKATADYGKTAEGQKLYKAAYEKTRPVAN